MAQARSARIVAAADAERRRVVRDLHDGAQERLVELTFTLKLAHAAVLGDPPEAAELLGRALQQVNGAAVELRELAHGILPSALAYGGLRPAVRGLVARMPIPVEISVRVERMPAPVEATAYFVVAEALTNAARHARATRAMVWSRVDDGVLYVSVSDDGSGCADPRGSSLTGLADRLAALDGELRVESPPGGGTVVSAEIPLAQRF